MDILTMYIHWIWFPLLLTDFFCYFIAFSYIWYRSRGVRSCKLIHFTICCTLILEKLCKPKTGTVAISIDCTCIDVKKCYWTMLARQKTDDTLRRITIGHLSDSGDIKIQMFILCLYCWKIILIILEKVIFENNS